MELLVAVAAGALVYETAKFQGTLSVLERLTFNKPKELFMPAAI